MADRDRPHRSSRRGRRTRSQGSRRARPRVERIKDSTEPIVHVADRRSVEVAGRASASSEISSNAPASPARGPRACSDASRLEPPSAAPSGAQPAIRSWRQVRRVALEQVHEPEEGVVGPEVASPRTPVPRRAAAPSSALARSASKYQRSRSRRRSSRWIWALRSVSIAVEVGEPGVEARRFESQRFALTRRRRTRLRRMDHRQQAVVRALRAHCGRHGGDRLAKARRPVASAR